MAKTKKVSKKPTKSAKPAPKKAKPVAKVKSAAKTPAKKAAAKVITTAKPKAKAKELAQKVKVTDAKKASKKGTIEVSKIEEIVESTVMAKAKTASKVKAKTKGKKTEKKGEDFEDDLLDDNFGDSEIAEYEDDLKAVEDEDEEITDEELEDDDSDTREAEVYLTDSEGRRLCRVRDCDQVANVDVYCRYHYLLLWKRIQVRKTILQDGKLEKYVVDLTSRYPDKFLEMIKKDMKSEKDFLSAIQELEIDESGISDMDDSDDDAQSFADEIRGVADAPVIDDDGDY